MLYRLIPVFPLVLFACFLQFLQIHHPKSPALPSHQEPHRYPLLSTNHAIYRHPSAETPAPVKDWKVPPVNPAPLRNLSPLTHSLQPPHAQSALHSHKRYFPLQLLPLHTAPIMPLLKFPHFHPLPLLIPVVTIFPLNLPQYFVHMPHKSARKWNFSKQLLLFPCQTNHLPKHPFRLFFVCGLPTEGKKAIILFPHLIPERLPLRHFFQSGEEGGKRQSSFHAHLP